LARNFSSASKPCAQFVVEVNDTEHNAKFFAELLQQEQQRTESAPPDTPRRRGHPPQKFLCLNVPEQLLA